MADMVIMEKEWWMWRRKVNIPGLLAVPWARKVCKCTGVSVADVAVSLVCEANELPRPYSVYIPHHHPYQLGACRYNYDCSKRRD
jgi:hypothetical protein